MSEHEHQPAAAPERLWLWIDTETTGLLESSTPAVLEVAWMVTTPDLRQLTPLRVRLAALAEPPKPPLAAWPNHLMEAAVAELHRESGLQDDWVRAPKGWSWYPRRLTDISELDTLVSADLDAAVIRVGAPDRAQVHLAGAGVAQFEARLLPRLGSLLTHWCHYRTADTSVAAGVVGLPKLDLGGPDEVEVDIPLGMDPARAIGTRHRAGADVWAAYSTAHKLQTATVGTHNYDP